MSKTSLDDTGERMIPAAHGRTIMFAEHMTRYIAAQKIAGGKVVLDIASGTGYGSKLLAEVAQKVYGVDVYKDAIKFAEENYNASNLEYLVGNAEKIPLADNSVDLVVSFETIEHIKDYKKFISEVKRVLKDDGLAIVSTPNDEEFAEGNHFHLHEFKLNELTGLLSQSFKYLKPYHQATWAYAQIADEKFIGTDNAIVNVEVHNFAPLPKEKYLYFYILCSNRKISEKIDNVGGLGGHYSARELGDISNHYQKQIRDHQTVLDNEKEEHQKTKIKLTMREHENHAITQSTSYKLARRLAASKQAARFVVGHARAANPKTRLMWAKSKQNIRRVYGSPEFTQAFAAPAEAKLAVIIHLYYADMLAYFAGRLNKIKDLEYDLYITIPENEQSARTKEIIRKTLPRARVAVVPNCGRDILPFVQVMNHIKGKGYTKVLKLHSKKSLHRDDVNKWRDQLIDSLLPGDPTTLKEINKLLEQPQTALIGPEKQYVSMLVNLSPTARYTRAFTRKILGRKKSLILMRHPDEYGFFAGSMFWARIDAIMPVISSVTPGSFEPELGQEDSTLAHALERLLNVIPELQGKDMFEIRGDKVEKIDYHTTNIPRWSEMHPEHEEPTD